MSREGGDHLMSRFLLVTVSGVESDQDGFTKKKKKIIQKKKRSDCETCEIFLKFCEAIFF